MKMIKNMVMVYLFGQMEENIWGIGNKGNKMAKGHL